MTAFITALAKKSVKAVLPPSMRIGVQKLYYRGKYFRCPLCGSSLRKLLDAGKPLPVLSLLDVVGGYRPNDTCPVCWSHARTRLIGAFLERVVFAHRASTPNTILHFAPEQQIAALIKRRGSHILYFPVDLHPERYRDQADVIRADINELPWEANYFDLIICNHVLEHVPDDRKALNELYRVMHPQGFGIFQVPFSTRLEKTIEDPICSDPRERELRFGQKDHVRIYGRDYPDRLQRAGFIAEVFDPVNQWGEHVIQLLRLDPKEKIFFVRK